MYRTAPALQPAPGTELIERYYGGTGFGSYVATEQYALSPAGQEGIRGMGCVCGIGCAGLGCGCAKCAGLGTFMDGTGFLGTGLFVSSSPADWGVGEWGVMGLAAFAVLSMMDTTRRGYHTVTRKSRAAKRAWQRE